MKELKIADAIILENRELEVIPYLMIKEMELIIENMLQTTSLLKQQQILVSNVLVCTTTIFDNEDTDCAYEDIIYSGLWDEIIGACPYLRQNIDTIWEEVKIRQNLEHKLSNAIDGVTKTVEQITKDPSLMTKLKTFFGTALAKIQDK